MDTTELDNKARQQQLEEEEKQRELARKNQNFFMIYKTKEGSAKLRQLINESPCAGVLFMFLAEHADRTNAIVASGKALAQLLNYSESTISRSIKILTATTEKDGKPKMPFLECIKSGVSNVFILNPNIVWSAWKTGKDYCLFGNAKVLVSSDEQDTMVKKRLNVLLSKSKEGEETVEENPTVDMIDTVNDYASLNTFEELGEIPAVLE